MLASSSVLHFTMRRNRWRLSRTMSSTLLTLVRKYSSIEGKKRQYLIIVLKEEGMNLNLASLKNKNYLFLGIFQSKSLSPEPGISTFEYKLQNFLDIE